MFFPTIRLNQGHTCSQPLWGRNSDFMYVEPMQNFGRKVGIPKLIKTYNSKTEIGRKWTKWCRHYCVNTKFTEPHNPWQNVSEQGIWDLGRMVKRYMGKFDAPLWRQVWYQRWYCDVRNHLASRKIGWRTPTKKLTGNAPAISGFRFHFREKIEYFNNNNTQPEDGWKPGQFLDIARNSGDDMTYYIEAEKWPGGGNNLVLVRSVIGLRQDREATMTHSGEIDTTNDGITQHNNDNTNPYYEQDTDHNSMMFSTKRRSMTSMRN